MLHVRGKGASPDDLDIARRSALAQQTVGWAVEPVRPMGGYGRKRPATATTRRPKAPPTTRSRPRSAQLPRRPPQQQREVVAQRLPLQPQQARAAAAGDGQALAAKPLPRALRDHGEKVPAVGCATPLPLPEVVSEGVVGGQTPSASQYPDILLLESWLNEMAERSLINKKQEVFSKVMFDKPLLSYTMGARHGESEVHNMWNADDNGLCQLGCTRAQLYEKHMSSDAVERLYRAFYIYAVGLPAVIKQIVSQCAAEEESLAVLCLSSYLHFFMEALKSTHGDAVATRVEDSIVAGVNARVRAYCEALDALKLEYDEARRKLARYEAEREETGGESPQQTIARLKDTISTLQLKIQQIMKSHSAALAALEEELLAAEQAAAAARKREERQAALADEERQLRAQREREMQAEIDRLNQQHEERHTETHQLMSSMGDGLIKLRAETWKQDAANPVPKPPAAGQPKLWARAHAAVVESIAKAVVREREDAEYKRERDDEARRAKEEQAQRELEEERERHAEELEDLERKLHKERDTSQDLRAQLKRAGVLLDRERAVVYDTRRMARTVATHQCGAFLTRKWLLRRSNTRLAETEAEREAAKAELSEHIRQRESERDKRKNMLSDRVAGQDKLLASVLAEVEQLKQELQESQDALSSKAELQDLVEAGQVRVRELLTEVGLLNSAHSGEMATREMHITRIEAQLQAAHVASDQATHELRQVRAEHVAACAQWTTKCNRLKEELEESRASEALLRKTNVASEIQEVNYKGQIEELRLKLSDAEKDLTERIQELEGEAHSLQKELRKTQSTAASHERFAAEAQERVDEVKATMVDRMLSITESLDRKQTELRTQTRLLNTFRDERDMLQGKLTNAEHLVVETRRKVVDADSAAEKSRAAAQQTSRELHQLELAYRGKAEDLAQASAHATQLEAQLEEMEATERAREQTARAQAESAVALSDSKGMVDVAVQSTGRTTFEMTSFMEELRVAEAAQARAEEERTQAREEARKAREACAALREEMRRLLRSTMPPDGENGQAAGGTTVASEGEQVPDDSASESEMISAPSLTVSMDSSRRLPRSLSSLMHQQPPSRIRDMGQKAAVALVRQLYAHCSRTLVECVGPSMQSLAECVYQFFELKYGSQSHGHEQHIYEFIGSVLRHSHTSPCLALFARFAGVVDDEYSVEAFRFFLYVLSCLSTSVVGSHGQEPVMFSEGEESSAPATIWLSQAHALAVFEKVMADARLAQVIRYELASCTSHRPSRKGARSIACVEEFRFLSLVMELWHERKVLEDDATSRLNMELRGASEGVSESLAELYLARWRQLREGTDQ